MRGLTQCVTALTGKARIRLVDSLYREGVESPNEKSSAYLLLIAAFSWHDGTQQSVGHRYVRIDQFAVRRTRVNVGY
jgi:hypothetical protein